LADEGASLSFNSGREGGREGRKDDDDDDEYGSRSFVRALLGVDDALFLSYE